jgi:phenylacetate-CoA ligase
MSYTNNNLEAYLRRTILLPLYWKYIKHSKVLKYYKELQTHQWNTQEENHQLQRKKLFQLIQYASQNIPYYQRVIQEHQISFSEDIIFTDLKKFPLLTKEIIRNNFNQLYKFRDHTYYRNSSGGSTGEPVIFYQDRYYFDWSIATKILFDEWAGRRIGEPMVKLWGSTRDILRGGQGVTGYLRQQISGVTNLESSRMTDQDKYQFVQRINQIKPCLLLIFPNSISELTRFIQDHHLQVYSPPAIMTSGGVLFPELKARIQEVFHTTIFNRYGSREVGDIACNCAQSEGLLHLIPDIHYLEIVDDKGKEVKPGEAGNIIITLLTNYTMPLIRYQIGDLGVLSKKNSPCGHGWPLLEKVVGRINSNFKNRFGEYIGAGIFYPLFYFQNNIQQFQIIQKTVDSILINLVLIEKNRLKDMDKFFEENNQKIEKIMGHQITVKYNIVDEIKPSPSGKYMYTFSKVGDL